MSEHLDAIPTQHGDFPAQEPADARQPRVLAVSVIAIRTLTVETQRSACYERLNFIGRPERDELGEGAALLCEGPSPVTRYSDSQ